MVNYDEDLPFCRQCQADLIGAPGEELCGTCGLPGRDPGRPGVLLTAARPVPSAEEERTAVPLSAIKEARIESYDQGTPVPGLSQWTGDGKGAPRPGRRR